MHVAFEFSCYRESRLLHWLPLISVQLSSYSGTLGSDRAMNLALLLEVIQTILVCWLTWNYTLKKLNPKLFWLQGRLEIIIFIWARRTMRVQKLGGRFFSDIWIKNTPPSSFPMFVQGCNVVPNIARIYSNAHRKCNIVALSNAICSIWYCIYYGETACIEWLYYACSYTIGPKRTGLALLLLQGAQAASLLAFLCMYM